MHRLGQPQHVRRQRLQRLRIVVNIAIHLQAHPHSVRGEAQAQAGRQPLPEQPLVQTIVRHPLSQGLGIAPMEAQQIGQPVVGGQRHFEVESGHGGLVMERMVGNYTAGTKTFPPAADNG